MKFVFHLAWLCTSSNLTLLLYLFIKTAKEAEEDEQSNSEQEVKEGETIL